MHSEDKPSRLVEVNIARFPFSVRAEVELIYLTDIYEMNKKY